MVQSIIQETPQIDECIKGFWHYIVFHHFIILIHIPHTTTITVVMGTICMMTYSGGGIEYESRKQIFDKMKGEPMLLKK